MLRLLLLLGPASQQAAGLVFAAACAALTLAAAARLNRGYLQTLEQKLRERAVDEHTPRYVTHHRQAGHLRAWASAEDFLSASARERSCSSRARPLAETSSCAALSAAHETAGCTNLDYRSL